MKYDSRFEQILTPIFTKEMGRRLSIIRMKTLQTQAEWAHFLGVSQQAYSALESGRQAVLRRPITLARWRAILGNHISYVFFGTNADKYRTKVITDRYWDARNSRDENVRAILGKVEKHGND